MTRTMKPYPAYKDSGVEWIGEIPTHWNLQRMKVAISSSVNGVWGNEEQGDDDDVVCIRVADFDMSTLGVGTKNLTIRNIPQSQQNGRVFNSGDLLIEKSGGGENQTVGRMIRFDLEHDKPAVCSNFVGKLCIKDLFVPDYFLYYACNLYAKNVNTRSIKQTTGIQNLDLDSYLNELMPVPIFAEQQAIADYLDRNAAAIDTLITKKERQIELLQEQRTAVINHAVTKGLNPHVPMKDSGTDWLSQVPQHWQMMKFKFFASIQKGQVDPRKDEYASMILVAPNHIESGTGRILYTETAAEQGADSGKYLFRSGDVIYSKIRPELRKACLASHDGLCSADMYPITTNEKMLAQFLLYVLLSEDFTKYSAERSMRVAMPKINRDDLNDCLFAVPPKSEQKVIVKYISAKSMQIDRGIQRIQKQIELLHEYRTALISAAVTGKIDVRP